MKTQMRLRYNKTDNFYYVDLGSDAFTTVGEIFYDINAYRFVPYQKIYFASSALEAIAKKLKELNQSKP